MRDIAYSVQVLRKIPGISLLAVMALALAIGANSVIFSFVDAILLRPLPVANPSELVSFRRTTVRGPSSSFSYSEYLDLRDQSRSLSGLLASGRRGLMLTVQGPPLLLTVCVVSPDYFPVLGIHAGAGRLFGRETEAPEQALVAVLSHKLWLKRFGGSTDIVGKPVRLNKRLCTVVGIAPRGFHGTDLEAAPDLWIPIHAWSQLTGEQQIERKHRWLQLMGRMSAGNGVEKAQQEIELIMARWLAAYPDLYKDTRLSVIPEFKARGEWPTTIGTLLILLAALVLMIACVNVANLVMAHLNSRRKEVAIRMALGAAHHHIFRLLMTECLVLGGAGLLLGLLLSRWLINTLPALLTSIPFAAQWDIRLDARVLAYAILIALISVFGFGLGPTWKMLRQDLNATLRDYSGTIVNPLRGRSLATILVIGQLAFTAVLLVAAGLLTRTFYNVRRVDPGFKSENRLLVWMVPASQGYGPDQLGAFYQTLLDRAQALPGALQATLVQRPPLYPIEGGQRLPVKIPGREGNGEKDLEIRYTFVWPNYFATMETAILRGRTFTGQENAQTAGSVLINESMERQFWPGEDPIGRKIHVGGARGRDCEIIGIVQDGKYVTLREIPAPYIYLPIAQWSSSDMTLVIHTSSQPRMLAGPIERELQQLAPNLPAPEISTLDEQLELAWGDERVAATLAGALSGLAACLALSGLYGLLSYSVRRRTREIGIRMSLGARTKTVLGMMIWESLRLILCGTGLGVIAGLVAARFLASQVYGIRARDPVTFLLVGFLLTAVSILACLVPARRASQVDPIEALRFE